MKITPTDYNYLKQALKQKHIELLNTETSTGYDSYFKLSSNERIGWDLVRATGNISFVCNTLYKYLNDSHIDTALNKIVNEFRSSK